MDQQAKNNRSRGGGRSGARKKRKVPYGQGRENIRRAAQQLFYLKGLGTGLDEILSEADVSKPTFYHHFAGKSELETDYLFAQARALWDGFDRISEKSRTPRQFITRWMDFVRRRTRAAEFRGCPLGNFAVQTDPQHLPDVHAVFGTSTKKFEEALVRLAVPAARARDLAADLFLIYQGSFLMVRATGECSHFSRATRLMLTMLDS